LNYLAKDHLYVLDANALAQDKLFSLDLFGNIQNYFVAAKPMFLIAHTSSYGHFHGYNSGVIKVILKEF
jgi:hypothetical protein